MPLVWLSREMQTQRRMPVFWTYKTVTVIWEMWPHYTMKVATTLEFPKRSRKSRKSQSKRLCPVVRFCFKVLNDFNAIYTLPSMFSFGRAWSNSEMVWIYLCALATTFHKFLGTVSNHECSILSLSYTVVWCLQCPSNALIHHNCEFQVIWLCTQLRIYFVFYFFCFLYRTNSPSST